MPLPTGYVNASLHAMGSMEFFTRRPTAQPAAGKADCAPKP